MSFTKSFGALELGVLSKLNSRNLKNNLKQTKHNLDLLELLERSEQKIPNDALKVIFIPWYEVQKSPNKQIQDHMYSRKTNLTPYIKNAGWKTTLSYFAMVPFSGGVV